MEFRAPLAGETFGIIRSGKGSEEFYLVTKHMGELAHKVVNLETGDLTTLEATWHDKDTRHRVIYPAAQLTLHGEG